MASRKKNEETLQRIIRKQQNKQQNIVPVNSDLVLFKSNEKICKNISKNTNFADKVQ